MKSLLRLTLAELYDLAYGNSADRRFLTFLTRHLQEKAPGPKVLDCACGTGDPGLHLATDFSVTLSDASNDMIQRAKQKGISEGLQVRSRRASWIELPNAFSEPFHAVVCAGDALTMARTPPQRRASLAGMASVLVEGGVLYADFAEAYNAPSVHGKETSVVGPIYYGGSYLVIIISERFKNGILDRIKTCFALSMKKCNKILQVRTQYKPVSRREIKTDLRDLGFSDIRFLKRPGTLSHLTCVLARRANHTRITAKRR